MQPTLMARISGVYSQGAGFSIHRKAAPGVTSVSSVCTTKLRMARENSACNARNPASRRPAKGAGASRSSAASAATGAGRPATYSHVDSQLAFSQLQYRRAFRPPAKTAARFSAMLRQTNVGHFLVRSERPRRGVSRRCPVSAK
ncbi:hypothetical protein VTO73DRAFT_14281 [Trametes versicolor]